MSQNPYSFLLPLVGLIPKTERNQSERVSEMKLRPTVFTLTAILVILMAGSKAGAYSLAQLRDNTGNRLNLPVGRWDTYVDQSERLRAGTFDDVLALLKKPDLTLQEAAMALYFASSKGFVAKKVSEADSFRYMFSAADVYLDPFANMNVARLSQRTSKFAGLRTASVDMTFLYLNRSWETGQILTENGVGKDIWTSIVSLTLGLADGFYAADLNKEYPTFKQMDKIRPEVLAFKKSFAELYGLENAMVPTTTFERHY